MLRFSLLFLLALPTVRAFNFNCPSGLDQYYNNGYCYGMFSGMKTQDQAESYCSSKYGAKLATINDPALNANFVSEGQMYESLWLGYRCNSKTQCSGNDGSVVNTSQYFYGGQANPSVGQCVVLETKGQFAGKWMSMDCNQTSSFVCGVNITNQVESNMKTSKCGAPYKLNVPVNITSMNYPSEYDKSENCAYFIYGGPFKIYFDYFSTMRGSDYVSIYSSSNNYGPLTLVGQYSGPLGPFNVTISTNSALITFLTNPYTPYNGFSARIVRN